MKLHQESHVDHGLTGAQLAHVLLTFEKRDAFFIETITLPEELGTVPCGLYGPIMGDPPIPAAHVDMVRRAGRAYPSRRLSALAPYGEDRRVNTVTVIAGPADDHPHSQPCVLYTVFGGPLAPKEPDDPTLIDDSKIVESIAFWSEHALRF